MTRVLQYVALGGVVLRVASITAFILAWEILGILPGRDASFFKPDSLRDRKPDIEGYNCWVDQLDRSGLDRNALLNIILDTGEFKKRSDDYYRLVEMHKGKLTIYREDISNKYGKQSYLSGFIFNFDSIKSTDGQHIYMFMLIARYSAGIIIL